MNPESLEMIATFNSENGIEAAVFPSGDRYRVRVRDTDAGEVVGFKEFLGLAKAMEYARKCVDSVAGNIRPEALP